MNNIHLHIIGSKIFSNLLNELDFNYSISSDQNLEYSNKVFCKTKKGNRILFLLPFVNL